MLEKKVIINDVRETVRKYSHDGERMSRLLTYCPYCGRVVPRGQRCQCRPRPKRKATAADRTRAQREPWRKQYATAEYRAARQQAIARTQGKCADCGRVCAWHDGKQWRTAGMGGEVDHECALSEGGSNSPGNLTLRCKSCHKRRDDRRRTSGT